MVTNIKTYSELIRLPTFEERFRYLKLGGRVGEETFGFDRWLNQRFYKDPAWIRVRDEVIIRDNGCDLAIPDREIPTRILVHHMNPITKRDILDRSEFLLNPEYLICTIKRTHDAIHYGDESILIPETLDRKPNDTCPWKRGG
jgi:hypothetical protein